MFNESLPHYKVVKEYRNIEGSETSFYTTYKTALKHFNTVVNIGTSQIVFEDNEANLPEEISFVMIKDHSGNIINSKYIKKHTERELLNKRIPNEFN